MIEIVVRLVEKIERIDWKKGLLLENLTVDITLTVEWTVV